jgi:hypothetical protein
MKDDKIQIFNIGISYLYLNLNQKNNYKNNNYYCLEY